MMAKTQTVNVGRELSREVNIDRLSNEVLDHVVYIGLRNILMDSHAGAAKVAGEGATDSEIQDVAAGMVDKKLDALYRGEIRVAGERTRTTDPVKKEAKRLATEYASKRVEWKNLSPAELREKVAQLLALPDSRFMRIAAENVARNAELDDMDIDI